MKNNFKLGILGGGQLGRMLLQSAVSYDIYVKMLDPNPDAPCSQICNEFVAGKLTDYEQVMSFGKDCDVLSIEIENVNTEALEALEKQGVAVFPQSQLIRLIQDKRAQKQFYKENNIPTSEFYLLSGKEELQQYKDFLPFVQKLGKEGYDGRGVQIMRSEADFEKGFEKPSLVEKLVDIHKEISIIIARNRKGEVAIYPPVELVYHPEYNMVDYLLSPAEISEETTQKANQIAEDLVEKMDFVGLLAVEMFVTPTGEILVNEVAPRTHNSGHHTIESNFTSQFEQHLRAVLNLPLGDTESRSMAAMVNLLGAEGHTGLAVYQNMEQLMASKGVYVHLYGKKMTKPSRKMGHISILADNKAELLQKVRWVKQTAKVVSC